MKRLLSLLILSITFAHAQKIDTVINTKIYTSYFSYQLHEPLYVIYSLNHGGGNCDRSADHFITGNLPHSATIKDYAKNGYDEGHLANSKDFAYDCALQEMTFRFYNCVPQTPKLNRGIWKEMETQVRKESQTEPLTVICGSLFAGKKIGPDSIAVPSYCYKVVISQKTKAVLHCSLFPNNNSNSRKDITIAELKSMIPYKIDW